MMKHRIIVIVGAAVLTAVPLTVKFGGDGNTTNEGARAGSPVAIRVEMNRAEACCSWAKRAWRATTRAVSRAARATTRAVSRAAHAVERGVSSAARATARAVRDGVDWVRDKAEKAAKAISDGLKKVGNVINEIGKKIGAAVSAAAKFVKEGLEYLVKLIADFWEMIVDWVIDQAKALANKAVKAAKEGVKKVFSGITNAVREGAEKVLRPVLKQLVEASARLPLDDLERLSKYQNNGKLDEGAIRGEVRKLVLSYIDPHIEPHVKWAVDQGFGLVKKGVDAAVKGVASGLGSIPIVGGPVFAAVIFTYNLSFDQLIKTVAEAVTGLVKKTVLGGIVDQALKIVIKPIVAQVQKLVDASGIPAFAKKVTEEVKRDVALGRQLVASMQQIERRVAGLDSQMKAKLEAVVARKLAAAKRFEEVAKQVADQASKAVPQPAPASPVPPEGGGR